MENIPKEIGNRIRAARKQKGITQKELGELIGKSLRSVQMYENGETELSIAMINEIAKKLDTSSTYLIGYPKEEKQINNLSDILAFLFQLENIHNLNYKIDVKKPPKHDTWECSITFNGKDIEGEYNADMCLFLEEYHNQLENLKSYMTSKDKLDEWKDKTLAYYSTSKLLKLRTSKSVNAP